jgi:hypothetical protein
LGFGTGFLGVPMDGLILCCVMALSGAVTVRCAYVTVLCGAFTVSGNAYTVLCDGVRETYRCEAA